MTKQIISLNNILNFNDIETITCNALGITPTDFSSKYYKIKQPPKTSGHFGHSSGGIGNSGRKYSTPSLSPLYSQWYSTRNPHWLYNHPEYFWEGLACSWEVSAPRSGTNVARELYEPHTNKYINSHPHLNIKYIEPIDIFNLEWNIFDWGAGVGLTTLVLSQNFPKSKVYYAGTPCSSEVKFFKEAINYLTLKGLDFSNVIIIEDLDDLPELDLLVGIEIVEHFDKPMNFLSPILEKIKVGGLFAHSSYWNSEKKMPTLGHFLEYDFDNLKGYLYSPRDLAAGNPHNNPTGICGTPSISSSWNKCMKNRKWKKLKHDPYGHKPVYWQKTVDTINNISIGSNEKF